MKITKESTGFANALASYVAARNNAVDKTFPLWLRRGNAKIARGCIDSIQWWGYWCRSEQKLAQLEEV